VKARVIVYRAAVTAGAAAVAAGFGIPSAQAQPASVQPSRHHVLRAPQPSDPGPGPSLHHVLTTSQPSDPGPGPS
jgi:hypothetical protein